MILTYICTNRDVVLSWNLEHSTYLIPRSWNLLYNESKAVADEERSKAEDGRADIIETPTFFSLQYCPLYVRYLNCYFNIEIAISCSFYPLGSSIRCDALVMLRRSMKLKSNIGI